MEKIRVQLPLLDEEQEWVPQKGPLSAGVTQISAVLLSEEKQIAPIKIRLIIYILIHFHHKIQYTEV